MAAVRDFIKRLGALEESLCSKCCQIIRPHSSTSTLEMAQEQHQCEEVSPNQVKRGRIL